MISDGKDGSGLLGEGKKKSTQFFFTDFKFKQLIGFLMNFQAVHVYSP